MKIILEEKDKALLKEILENLPQYSYSHLKCVGWDYKKMEFSFSEDTDPPTEHELTFQKALEGFQKWLDLAVTKGEGGGIELAGLFDAGNYDINMVDEIVQLALLGEVVYG